VLPKFNGETGGTGSLNGAAGLREVTSMRNGSKKVPFPLEMRALPARTFKILAVPGKTIHERPRQYYWFSDPAQLARVS
jgi:hypothetical protein